MGSWITRFDGTGEWSREAFAVIGLKPGSAPPTFETFLATVHPDDREMIRADWEARPGEARSLRFRIVDATRGTRTIDATRRLLRNEEGEPVGMMGTMRDVTDVLSIELRLRENEKRFRALVENSSDGIALLDADGRILYGSPAACSICGVPTDGLDGRSIREFIHPDDHDGLETIWKTILASPGVPVRQSVRFQRRDGIRHIEVVRTNHLDDPALRAIVSNFRDVTERIELEEEFRHSQKMEAVGRLAGGVAHDFNNLMTVVLSYSSILLGELSEDDPIREDIGEILRAGERAVELTRQLLAFSRRQILNPRLLDLRTLLQGSEKLLRRLVGERIRVEIAPGTVPATICADPGAVEQCLMNLVVNARDAMPSGGRLWISVGDRLVDAAAGRELEIPPGNYQTLVVRDEGVGMNAATMARIFEPFFTTKAKGKGTGLGLSTVFGIVKQSGGALSVVSTPGNGATFTLLFPHAAGDEEPSVPERVIACAGRGARILVVEDDPAVREATRRTLVLAGHDVTAASGPGEALVIAEQREFDLLLSDVVMPWMNGPELAARILEKHPSIRVLLVSGYSDPADEALIGGDVPLNIISKPLTGPRLEKAIEEALAQKT